MKYSKIYLRDTTLISPFPMMLFGGEIDIQHRERLITLDGWIHFQVRSHRVFYGFSSVTAAAVLKSKFEFVRQWNRSSSRFIWLNPCCSLSKAPVRIGVIFKHLRKLMDSLLEKKLENPRMSLEGKLERLNTTYGMKTAHKVLIDLCLCVFLTIINQMNFRCSLQFIKAWPRHGFTCGIDHISYNLL